MFFLDAIIVVLWKGIFVTELIFFGKKKQFLLEGQFRGPAEDVCGDGRWGWDEFDEGFRR